MTVAPAARGLPQFRLGLAGRIGLGLIALMLLACVATIPWSMGKVETGATVLSRYEASNLTLNLLPPIWQSLGEADAARIESAREAGQYIPGRVLGTDRLGRDVLARLLAGGSVSLLVGLSAAAIAMVVGTLYGTLAGSSGGRVDAVMMRVVDILFGLPSILLVVLLAVAVDGVLERRGADLSPIARQAINISTLLVAIGGVSWLTMARVIRGQVLSLKAKPFMEASRAIGVLDAKQQDGAHAERSAREGRRAGMVRLDPPAGDDARGALRARVCEEELELAELVAGLGAAGRVVPLDPELDAFE